MSGAMAGMVAAIVVALVSGLAAYIGTVRKLSGKIGTTEASELWEYAKEQQTRSDKRIADLEARVAVLERRNNDLERENLQLGAKVEKYERS